MQLQIIKDRFCVCKIDDVNQVDIQSEFFFLAKTHNETSLVCLEHDAPKDCVAIDRYWRGLCIVGILDFSLVGILADISAVLAKAGVPIFAVSTYDTDYILVKEENFDRALAALKESGYDIK
ncbi:MAG: ACT domain-containing protein [Clostridia bacterium]|nr:ACT domain-containing protein [Clostridia bacterium]